MRASCTSWDSWVILLEWEVWVPWGTLERVPILSGDGGGASAPATYFFQPGGLPKDSLWTPGWWAKETSGLVASGFRLSATEGPLDVVPGLGGWTIGGPGGHTCCRPRRSALGWELQPGFRVTHSPELVASTKTQARGSRFSPNLTHHGASLIWRVGCLRWNVIFIF